MTLQEILRNSGLTDEQIQTVLSTMKENKIFTTAEENMDIRYNKLKGEHETLTNQYKEASALIENLKKDNKGNEDLQGKITTYESQVSELQNELVKTKTESAIKVALLSAKANDVDYLTFKIKEKGDELKIDDNGNIKGIEDIISGLKTQFPSQFEGTTDDGKKIIEKKLEDGKKDEPSVTKDDFNKMGYNSRVKLKQDNPELYEELTR